MIISLITLCFSFLYVIFLFWCLYHWNKIEDKSGLILKAENTKVAVIIPARNEAENLKYLIQSLVAQSYPIVNFQIIICDDHSTDNTFEVAEDIFNKIFVTNGICLKSPGNSKKEAITYAIQNSNAELIITTDADTLMGTNWISSIVQEYVNSNSLLISSPVELTGEKKFIERLQTMEFIGLSAIGAAGIKAKLPMFCNGANLAFSKKIFDEVNGYENSKSISGDDTQLMLKVYRKYPAKISFLKDARAIVQTKVIKGKSELLHQRKRWASKIPTTLSTFTIFISILSWFVHAFLLIQLFNSFFHFNFLLLFLPFFMVISTELILLKSVGKFFNEKIPSWMIIVAQPFYCIYIVVVGLLSPFNTYQWKGRKNK